MKLKRLKAHGGQVYNYRMDVQTVFTLKNITEELEKTLQVSPSQAVLIRRALRYYGTFIMEELPRTIHMLETEKTQLIRAAGRKNTL